MNTFKWQNSLWFSASSIRQQHWLRERRRQVTLRSARLYATSLTLLVLSSLDLRIFADEGETGPPCHTLVPQFCILKSMSCPVAACSFFLIPVKETTSRITPVRFQEDSVLTLILKRQIFIWGNPAYLSCFVFLPGPVGTINKFISLLGNDGWTCQSGL